MRPTSVRTEASSSAKRIVSPGRALAGGATGGALPATAVSERRRNTSNVVPRPTAVRTRTPPPCCPTTFDTFASPSPVPRPTAFVVKKGSNARARVSSSIPIAGVRDRQAHVAARREAGHLPRRPRRRASTVPVEIVRTPPSGIASCALTPRFRRICAIWVESARTGVATSAELEPDLHVLPDRAPQDLRARADLVGQVEVAQLEGLSPTEGQQPPRQVPRPLARALDLLDVAAHLGAARRPRPGRDRRGADAAGTRSESARSA